MEGQWRRVGAVAEMPLNCMKTFLVNDVSVLIVHTGDAFVAVQALCPHEAVPLDQGVVDGSTLTCLEHLWQFDVKSGAALGEAEECLQTYPLRIEHDQLYVALDATTSG
jgi:toluene monooxygenase system ferredoxin subunit